MRRTAGILIVTLHSIVLLHARAASAQEPRQPLVRSDVSVGAGWLGAKHPSGDEYDDWTHSAAGVASASLYWTDHIRTEVEVGWTGEGESFENVPAPVGGPIARVYQRTAYRHLLVSVGQAYQFRRNARFHPLVIAGVEVERERLRIERPPQPVYLPSDPRIAAWFLDGTVSRETHVRVRPFAAAGFKAYFSERGFVRTDMKLRIGRGADRVMWKVSAGVDF